MKRKFRFSRYSSLDKEILEIYLKFQSNKDFSDLLANRWKGWEFHVGPVSILNIKTKVNLRRASTAYCISFERARVRREKGEKKRSEYRRY